MISKKLNIIYLLAFLFMTGCSFEGSYQRKYKPSETIEFKTIEGKSFLIGNGMNKPMVVVFFTTWCPACKSMLPQFQKAVDRIDTSQTDVVAFGREHTNDEMISWAEGRGLSFGIAADPDREIFSQFASQDVPRVFVFDSNGNIVWETVAWIPEKADELLEVVDSITIAEKAPD